MCARVASWIREWLSGRRTAARTISTSSRGDELPERLRTTAGQRAALREGREELECERNLPRRGADREWRRSSTRRGLLRAHARRAVCLPPPDAS